MAKWDGLRYIDRNQAIVDYHRDHPEISQEEIGKVFGGITKQRVGAILKKAREA